MKQLKLLVQELVAIPGLSGYESRVAEYLSCSLEPYVALRLDVDDDVEVLAVARLDQQGGLENGDVTSVACCDGEKGEWRLDKNETPHLYVQKTHR